MKILLHPSYFPNIVTFATIVQNEICWEVEDNYQKQTYRNRCYICTDRGKHLMTIPIQHVGGSQGRQKYKDVLLDNSYQWQRQHWRTLQTAYRTSPFFEFYEDDLAPLYQKVQIYLLDFNLKTIETICNCLQIDMPTEKTSRYDKNLETGQLKPKTFRDARFLVNAKKKTAFEQSEYPQVFGDRHDFVNNASVLDLLFNEGTQTLDYLKSQNLDF